MDQKTWILSKCSSLEGKTAAVTGATGGLGREICRGILMLKGNLLLLNRSESKTKALKQELLREFPRGEIAFFPLDLENMDSVNAACEYLSTHTPDILLHNAGIYDVPRHLCSTGLDNIFQVNFASPYYMTRQLLPALRQARSHVAVVGSIAHTYSLSDPEDPDFHTRQQCHLAYGNSKRYLMYAFSALFQDETSVSFSIGHPGITLTNISNHYPAWLFPLIRPFLKCFFMKPETAARGILYALSHDLPNLSWAGPEYFHIWGSPGVKFLSTCSPEERQRIFKTAEAIYEKLL